MILSYSKVSLWVTCTDFDRSSGTNRVVLHIASIVHIVQKLGYEKAE